MKCLKHLGLFYEFSGFKNKVHEVAKRGIQINMGNRKSTKFWLNGRIEYDILKNLFLDFSRLLLSNTTLLVIGIGGAGKMIDWFSSHGGGSCLSKKRNW